VIDCTHWNSCGIADGGCCQEGHFGGKPSFGVCGQCKHRKGKDGEGVVKLLRAVPKVLTALTVSGTDVESERRLSICRGCEHFNGTRCLKCGCFSALKVRLATEHCPIGKW